jgi:hypothetical protein
VIGSANGLTVAMLFAAAFAVASTVLLLVGPVRTMDMDAVTPPATAKAVFPQLRPSEEA